MAKSLKELRLKIDEIDEKILRLISRRARMAKSIGEAKTRKSDGVLDLVRERAVLRAAKGANPGPLSSAAVEAVFREIISACRDSQKSVVVGYLGPPGTFSHEAAVKQFGATVSLDPLETIADVFGAVETGRCDYGVVPIENTTEGAVTPTLDALATTTAKVLGEVVVKVELCLLAKTGDQKKIRRVASHPQPLAQCRNFLADRFRGAEQQATASTTAAARLAASRPATAAIGSRLAASIYGLQIIADSIQDNAGNVTRFLVIGAEAAMKRSGNDRTSLVISVRDEVGVLERLLKAFARNGVNLSMIESRPLLGRRWEYSFFIDVNGHAADPSVSKAFAEIEKVALAAKVLGSYPIAD